MEIFYEKGKKYNCRVKGIPYFRTSVTINGKSHQVYGDGEKDAIKKKDELKAKAAAGYDLDHRNAKVGVVLRYWLFNVKRVDKNLKASTFERYECSFRNHIVPYDIVNCKLSSLSFAVMQRYTTELYEEHDVHTQTITNLMKVWKLFTKWALAQGYIVKDPCVGLSVPGKYDKKKKEIVVFTEAERKQILDYMRESHYEYDTLIQLAFATGMRKGELLALTWDCVSDRAIEVKQSTAVVTHVDKDGNRDRYREVWDTKTLNSERTIPILPSTAQMIARHRAIQREYYLRYGLGKPEYVFTTRHGGMVESTALTQSYKAMLKRAGVEYKKFHAIRHTFATEAIRRGVDVKDLQLLMGHSDIQTTYIYVQSDDESKRNAIEKMGAMM